jgi:hypothetical protein
MHNKAFGDCEGPFGLPMKSAVARYIDEVCRSLPESQRVLKRVSFDTLDMTFVDGERADVSIITTPACDRQHESMNPLGADWTQFQKAGMPVTFAHKYDQLPVGRGAWVKRNDKGWIGKTLYMTRPDEWPVDEPWFADAVWHGVRQGMLKGKSIGFIPVAAHEPTAVELKAMPDCVRIIDKWLALEWAVAPVPVNPEAMQLACAKGEIEPCLLDALGLKYNENHDDRGRFAEAASQAEEHTTAAEKDSNAFSHARASHSHAWAAKVAEDRGLGKQAAHHRKMERLHKERAVKLGYSGKADDALDNDDGLTPPSETEVTDLVTEVEDHLGITGVTLEDDEFKDAEGTVVATLVDGEIEYPEEKAVMRPMTFLEAKAFAKASFMRQFDVGSMVRGALDQLRGRV